MESDQRVPALKRRYHIGELLYAQQFSAADGYPAGQLFRRGREFLLGLLRQGNQLLGPAPEQEALRREINAVLAALKQLDAQFSLQLLELPGERGLGDVQQLRRPGDVLLPSRH